MITTEIISFATVLFTAVCVASLISILYAWGLRMWSDARWTLKQRSSDAPSDLGHLLHRLRRDRPFRPLADDSHVH